MLLLTDWPEPSGGVETYLLLLAGGLRAAGDDVRLVASSAGEGARHADHVAYGATRPAAQALLQVWNPLAARRVRAVVRDFRPDVALVAMFEMHLSPTAVAALAPTPYVLAVAYYKPICPTGLKLLPDGSLCDVQMGAVCVDKGCLGRLHWQRDRVRYARYRRRRGGCHGRRRLQPVPRARVARGRDLRARGRPGRSCRPRRASRGAPPFGPPGRLARPPDAREGDGRPSSPRLADVYGPVGSTSAQGSSATGRCVPSSSARCEPFASATRWS